MIFALICIFCIGHGGCEVGWGVRCRMAGREIGGGAEWVGNGAWVTHPTRLEVSDNQLLSDVVCSITAEAMRALANRLDKIFSLLS